MSDPTVVLVHGFATSADRTWRDNGWIDLLTDVGREVIAIDLLGHGTRRQTPRPAAYERLEALVAEQLPDEPVDAIGFSWARECSSRSPPTSPSASVASSSRASAPTSSAMIRSDLITGAIRREGDRQPRRAVLRRPPRQTGQRPEALVVCMRAPGRPSIDGRHGEGHVPRARDHRRPGLRRPGRTLGRGAPGRRLLSLAGVDHFATPKDFGFLDAGLEFVGAPSISTR